MDRDDLALVRQKVPVYRGGNRVSVRNQPHLRLASDRSEEVGKPVSRRGQEGTDVVHDVGRTGRLLDYPPHDERDSEISEDGFNIHVDSHRRRDLSCLPENLMLAPAVRLANANGVKL